MSRNNEALARVVRELAMRAGQLGIPTDRLPAIAPTLGALRIDAIGEPPIFELTYFERGISQTLEETHDEIGFVRAVLRTVKGALGMTDSSE